MESVICTEDLTCHFGRVRALQDLSIEVPQGSIFGFLGHNGAGKTTTIRLLLGLIQPTRGKASILGYDSQSQGTMIRYHTGALLEDPGLYERLSARHNLEFFARIWRLKKKEREKRIKEILSHMGLWERSHEQVDTWSRGMKQRLAISRVLLHYPSLLFMDEPTAGLDPVAAASLREDIAELVEREGVTIFLTTHNLEEAEKLCHHLAIIRDGRLIISGKPEIIKKRTSNLYYLIRGEGLSPRVLDRLKIHRGVNSLEEIEGSIRLELNPGMEMASIVEVLVEEGVKIREVIEERGSLEETFLELMKEGENEGADQSREETSL